MKSWSAKLVFSFLVTVLVTFLVGFGLYISGIGSIVLPIIISAVLFLLFILRLKIFSSWRWGALGIIPVFVVLVGLHWTFNSSNTTASFATFDEYVSAPDKPLYFDVDSYYIYFEGAGGAEVITTRTKRGVSRESKRNYIVYPVASDTNTVEFKIWFADNYSESQYDNAEYLSDLLNDERILYFEATNEDMYEDYNTALGYSPYKSVNDNVIFITPRYEPYITRNTWGLIFLGGIVLGSAVMVIIGMFVSNYKKKNEHNESDVLVTE